MVLLYLHPGVVGMTDKGKVLTVAVCIGSILFLTPGLFISLLVLHTLTGVSVMLLKDDFNRGDL